MREIPLTQGQVAIVDDADYAALRLYKWHAVWMESSHTFYAHRRAPKKDGNRVISMHRQICGFPQGEVDHKDHNGLNNQRENLRPCTHAQNCHNSAADRDSTSGLKGVVLTKRIRNPWKARITSRGKRISLGSYPSAEIAARAYDRAALAHFGEFAHFNFPEVLR